MNKQDKTMKYKILLATSIFATVQFYTHGAEGGAAAATGDLAAIPAEEGAVAAPASRLLTTADFTAAELVYICNFIIIEETSEKEIKRMCLVKVKDKVIEEIRIYQRQVNRLP